MSEEVNNDKLNIGQSGKLLDEFEELILNVSKDIIDNSVMQDFKVIKNNLTDGINDFSDNIGKFNIIRLNMDNLLNDTTENMDHFLKTTTENMTSLLKSTTEDMTSVLKSTNEDMDGFLKSTTHKMDSIINSTTDTLNNELKEIKHFLVDSSDLIEKNQKSIASIEEKIEETLIDVQNKIVKNSEESKAELKSTLEEIKTSFGKIVRDDEMITEQNKVIDLKVNKCIAKLDNCMGIISEVSAHVNDESSSIKRFKISIILNSMTLFAILSGFIVLLWR